MTTTAMPVSRFQLLMGVLGELNSLLKRLDRHLPAARERIVLLVPLIEDEWHAVPQEARDAILQIESTLRKTLIPTSSYHRMALVLLRAREFFSFEKPFFALNLAFIELSNAIYRAQVLDEELWKRITTKRSTTELVMQLNDAQLAFECGQSVTVRTPEEFKSRFLSAPPSR